MVHLLLSVALANALLTSCTPLSNNTLPSEVLNKIKRRDTNDQTHNEYDFPLGGDDSMIQDPKIEEVESNILSKEVELKISPDTYQEQSDYGQIRISIPIPDNIARDSGRYRPEENHSSEGFNIITILKELYDCFELHKIRSSRPCNGNDNIKYLHRDQKLSDDELQIKIEAKCAKINAIIKKSFEEIKTKHFKNKLSFHIIGDMTGVHHNPINKNTEIEIGGLVNRPQPNQLSTIESRTSDIYRDERRIETTKSFENTDYYKDALNNPMNSNTENEILGEVKKPQSIHLPTTESPILDANRDGNSIETTKSFENADYYEDVPNNPRNYNTENEILDEVNEPQSNHLPTTESPTSDVYSDGKLIETTKKYENYDESEYSTSTISENNLIESATTTSLNGFNYVLYMHDTTNPSVPDIEDDKPKDYSNDILNTMKATKDNNDSNKSDEDNLQEDTTHKYLSTAYWENIHRLNNMANIDSGQVNSDHLENSEILNNEHSVPVMKIVTREFPNGTATSVINGTETMKYNYFPLARNDSHTWVGFKNDNDNSDSDNLNEFRDDYRSSPAESEDIESSVTVPNSLIGHLYLVHDRQKIPARFIQDDDGKINVGIDILSLCHNESEENKPSLIKAICNCIEVDLKK